MARFRKKPIVIEAVQWTGKNYEEIKAFAGDVFICWYTFHNSIALEGEMNASLNDWIIRGIKDEIYPCRDDIFRMTYEAVDG